MGMRREVLPEWLDELPADDRRAIRSRRDLRLLNIIMRQASLMARALLRHWEQNAAGHVSGQVEPAFGRPLTSSTPKRILELGAGDGTFMLRLALRLAPRWPHVEVMLLDRQAIVSEETRAAFTALGWRASIVTSDAFAYLEQGALSDVDIVTANLFLHHFSEEELKRLFARAAPLCRLFAASEPRRSNLALLGSRLSWVIGCNDVTLHDAVISVRAGFRGAELSALWPEQAGTILHEGAAGLFSHCFVAGRPIEAKRASP